MSINTLMVMDLGNLGNVLPSQSSTNPTPDPIEYEGVADEVVESQS